MKPQLILSIFYIIGIQASHAQDDESLKSRQCFPEVERLEQLNTVPASLDSMWLQALTTADVLQVGHARFVHADSVLNVIYIEILSSFECLRNYQGWDEKLVDELEQSLKEAQRAWIVQRDAESEFFQLSARGGTIGNQWYLNEVFEATWERNVELIEFLEHLAWVDSF